MTIFINDRPLRLTDVPHAELIQQKNDYDIVIDARLEALRAELFNGHVLILNASPATVDRALVLFYDEIPEGLQSVTLSVAAKKPAEDRLKSHFRIVKAAGGVIFKDDLVLLIYRLKRWDLPKGKLDPDEGSKDAALREVEEETGVVAELEEKICTTWHTYTHNGNRILKRTKWYRMACVDDTNMAPQWEEDIERLAWMDKKQIQNALVGSYSSIRYVFERLYAKELEEN